MKRKAVSGVMLTVLLISMLLAAFEIREASANPTVRVYVKPTYIPVVPVGQIINVTINIESPPEWKNTVNGIVGWGFYVAVNPNVLEPITVVGSKSGYLLYDFANEHGYSTGLVFEVNKTAGLFKDVSEFILGYDFGAGGDGTLCELQFKSKSQTAETPIHIYNAQYFTPASGWVPVDIVNDGLYIFWKRDPVAVITGPVEEWVNKTITFSGAESYEPSGTPIVSYLWDFGDGNVTSTANPTIIHTYTSNGTYKVKLVVTDAAGWVSMPAEHTIKIFIGDINDDRKIDAYDLFILSRAYGLDSTSPNWNPNADINSDEKVDNADLLILTQNYGKNIP